MIAAAALFLAGECRIVGPLPLASDRGAALERAAGATS